MGMCEWVTVGNCYMCVALMVRCALEWGGQWGAGRDVLSLQPQKAGKQAQPPTIQLQVAHRAVAWHLMRGGKLCMLQCRVGQLYAADKLHRLLMRQMCSAFASGMLR